MQNDDRWIRGPTWRLMEPQIPHGMNPGKQSCRFVENAYGSVSCADLHQMVCVADTGWLWLSGTWSGKLNLSPPMCSDIFKNTFFLPGFTVWCCHRMVGCWWIVSDKYDSAQQGRKATHHPIGLFRQCKIRHPLQED